MFKISKEEFKKNYDTAKKLCKRSGWTYTRKNNFGKPLQYMTWSHVWFWAKTEYPTLRYEVEKVADDYLICSLWIDDTRLGNQILNLETFVSKNYKTGENKETKEKHEKVVMRILVKLVAQYLGFGLHLWTEVEKQESDNTPATYSSGSRF